MPLSTLLPSVEKIYVLRRPLRITIFFTIHGDEGYNYGLHYALLPHESDISR